MTRNGLFLGIDGGGTRCRARITDTAGTLLGEAVAGPANTRLGIERVFREIVAACEAALVQAGLPRSALGRLRAGLGLAGLNLASERVRIESHPHPFALVVAASDAHVACLGAHDGADGAIMIVGTGSAGYGIVGGRTLTVGGWGFNVGDQGSGAMIGRAAIRQSLLAHEEVLPPCPFIRAVMARFDNDPDKVVQWGDRATPRDYAALAPLVLEFADRDDPIALAIVTRAAADTARFLDVLVRAGATKVALVGGLAQSLTPHLPQQVQAILVEPKGDALAGALLMARRARTSTGA